MAQNEEKKSRRSYRTLVKETEKSESPIKGNEAAGTITRVATGIGALPIATRAATKLASKGLNKVPGLGTGLAATIGGAGELLAQVIEQGGEGKIIKPNIPRVLVEAGLSAVPIPVGSKGKAAAKGGAIAAGGVIGRKATDEDPNTSSLRPSDYNWWDLAQVGFGAGAGAAFNKAAPKAAPPVNPKRLTIEDVLKTKRWTAQDIEREAARAEALGDPNIALGLRIASAKTNTGNTNTFNAAAAAQKRDLDQTVRNENAREKFQQKGWEQEAKNLNLAEKRRAADWQQEARNANTTEKFQQTIVKAREAADAEDAVRTSKQANAEAVEQRLAELQAGGASAQTVVSKTSTMETPEGSVKATTVIGKKGRGGGKKGAPKDGTSKGPAGPTAKEGVYQVYDSTTGRIVGEFPDDKTALSLIEAAGPGNPYRVVEPTEVLAAKKAAAPVTKVPPAAAQGVKVDEPVAPKEPEVPFNPPKMVEGKTAKVTETDDALKTLEEIQELTGGAGAASVAGRGTMPAEPPAAPISKLPGPLGLRVAEASKAPEGQQFARFFRSPEKAKVAQEFASKMSPELQDLFTPILAQYDAAGKKTVNARSLGEMLSQMRDSLGLPKQARTLKAQPGSPKAAGKVVPPVAATPSAPKAVASGQPSQTSSGADLPDTAPAAPQRPSLARMPIPSTEGAVGSLDDAGLALLQSDLEGQLAKLPATASDSAQPLQQRLNEVLQEITRRTGQYSSEGNELAKELAKRTEGGTTLGFGLGGAQDIMDAIGRNPELFGGMAGAGAGAMINEDDPLSGAVIGGTAGALGPQAIKSMAGGAHLTGGLKPSDKMVNWQRAALLSHPHNLGINILAPTGGGIMGSLEKIATGLGEKAGLNPVTEAMQHGTSGLMATLNLSRFLPKNLARDLRTASQRIEHAEGRADMITGGGSEDVLDKIMSFPARLMTMGDEGVRGGLQNAGWSEDAARAVTVTSEPRYDFGKALVNLSRSGGAVSRMLLPFSKTAANVIEGSFERTPILGLLAQKAATDPELKATVAEIAARQGMGGLVSFIAYQAGQEVDPETAGRYKLPLIIANMSGQYGALAAAAFAAGQASYTGKEPLQQGGTAVSSFLNDLPLPTTETPQDLWKALESYKANGSADPNAVYPPQKYIPEPMLPRFLNDNVVGVVDEAVTGSARGQRSYRRLTQ
jgi:hypothetical protein